MKLHLPKTILAALVACVAATSTALAASNATATTTADGVTTRWYGSQPDAATGGIMSNVNLSGLDATSDKVVLNMTGGHFSNGSWTCVAPVEIKNLTINDGYSNASSGGCTYTFTGPITGTGNFAFTGTPTDQHYVFNGDMSEYTGAMSLNARNEDRRSFTFNGITVGASSINVGNAGSNYVDVNGSTIKGDLTANKLNIGVSGDKTVSTFEGTTTAGTITMGAGVSTIVNSGTFTATTVNINGLSGLTEDTSAPSYYSENGNGYKVATYKLVSNEGSGTVNIGAVNVLGAAATLSDDKTAFTTSATSGVYYVNSGTVDYGTADTAIYSDNTTGIVLSGGNLNMTQSLTTTAKTAGIHVDKAGNTTAITLGEGVVLDQTNLTATTATTLSGSGTYNINTDSLALGSNISTSDTDWSGTIRITNATINNTATNNIGKLNSYGKVEISGLTGYLYENDASSGDSWNTRITADIVMLEGTAITLNSGSSQVDPSVRNHEFSGTISGTGDFAITANTVSSNVFKFSGDTSEWTGTFSLNFTDQKNADEYPVTLEFSGVSNIGTNVSVAAGNTLKLIISGDTADGVTSKSVNGTMPTTGTLLLETSGSLEKVFTNAVIAKSATLDGGAVTFSNALTLTDNSSIATDVVVDGALTLTQDKALTISEGKTMKVGGITFKANSADSSIVRTADGSGAFDAGSDDFSLTGLSVVGMSSNLTTQLKNVDLVNESGYTKLNNSGSSYRNITVNQGSIGVLADTVVTGDVTAGGDGGDGQGVYMDRKTLSVGGTMTIGSGATLTTEADSAVAKVDGNGGNVTIASNGMLQIKSKDTGALDIAGLLTLEDGAKINLGNLGIAVADDQQVFTLANVGGLSVLGSVTVEGLSLGDRAWVLQTAGGTEVASGGTEGQITSGQLVSGGADSLQLIVAGSSTPTPGTLTETNVTGASYQPDAVGGAVLTLTTDIVAGSTLGDSLTVTFENKTLWDENVAEVGNIYQDALVQLAYTDGTLIDLSTLNSVSVNGVVLDENGKAFVAYIPEPTTGTLSVLALAALALRRRRK